MSVIVAPKPFLDVLPWMSRRFALVILRNLVLWGVNLLIGLLPLIFATVFVLIENKERLQDFGVFLSGRYRELIFLSITVCGWSIIQIFSEGVERRSRSLFIDLLNVWLIVGALFLLVSLVIVAGLYGYFALQEDDVVRERYLEVFSSFLMPYSIFVVVGSFSQRTILSVRQAFAEFQALAT